jgi:hypothetical protein
MSLYSFDTDNDLVFVGWDRTKSTFFAQVIPDISDELAATGIEPEDLRRDVAGGRPFAVLTSEELIGRLDRAGIVVPGEICDLLKGDDDAARTVKSGLYNPPQSGGPVDREVQERPGTDLGVDHGWDEGMDGPLF